ncbi:MAG: hypothetical protein ACRD0U_04750, partial [Acidimicrobiales bacterium]
GSLALARSEALADRQQVVDRGAASAYRVAVDQQRAVVTENFGDFAILVDQRLGRDAPSVPVVFVRKRDFPREGALASHLARHLNDWAEQNPEPYRPHWP